MIPHHLDAPSFLCWLANLALEYRPFGSWYVQQRLVHIKSNSAGLSRGHLLNKVFCDGSTCRSTEQR